MHKKDYLQNIVIIVLIIGFSITSIYADSYRTKSNLIQTSHNYSNNFFSQKSGFFQPAYRDNEIHSHIKENGILKKTLSFFPPFGHFYGGQWRKGTSDLWNNFTIFWFLYEPYISLKQWDDKLGHEEPTSRHYKLITNNKKLYRHLQYCLFTMVAMNYINSVVDCFSSDDDESFFGTFVSIQSIHHSSYIDRSWGDEPNTEFVYAPYGGLTFGYRNIFEFYAKMFFPNPWTPIMFCNFYSDYIIPYKFHENLDFYIGIGLVAGGYERKEPETHYGGGLGSGPRIGCSYIMQNHHYMRFTVIPYPIWCEVKSFEYCEEDTNFFSTSPRFSQQPFGDNFGIEFIYRYKLARKLYAESLFQFSRLIEPGGEYTERGISISIDERASIIYRFDFSLNYNF